jgi:hypothetical protein
MKRFHPRALLVTILGAFAAGALIGYTSSPAVAQQDMGTCFSECTPDTDCNHQCSVETAQGIRWMTCGQFGRCRRDPEPCRPDWRAESYTFIEEFRTTVEKPWGVRCVSGGDFWVTYRDVACDQGTRVVCESHTFTQDPGACSFERGNACTWWAL